MSRLFKDDPDLMKGFYHFLPDRNVQQRMAKKLDELAEDMPLLDDRYARRKGDGSVPISASRMATTSSLPQKRKRKAPEREKERERELAPKAGPSKVSGLVSFSDCAYVNNSGRSHMQVWRRHPPHLLRIDTQPLLLQDALLMVSCEHPTPLLPPHPTCLQRPRQHRLVLDPTRKHTHNRPHPQPDTMTLSFSTGCSVHWATATHTTSS